MAYVEWHQEIRTHYKTEDLMRRLGITRREALGIIGSISSWAIGHRPGGIIEKKLIQVAVDWEKDPAPLLAALIDVGWLDEFDDERVEVHDWEEITQGFRKARKDAARKKRERKERKAASEKAAKVQAKTVHGRDHKKTVRGRSKERRSEQNEQNEQNERTRAGQPPQKSYNNHNQPPSSGSSGGTTAPERDAAGSVVAVSDRKAGEGEGSAAPTVPLDRLLKQASSRLGTPILEAIGVDGGIAGELAKAYPTVRILHVAEQAKKQENPGGFARKALELGWTVPDSNGAGLAKLLAALEAEILANDQAWARLGSASGRVAPDRPRQREGESERDYTVRVDEWLKSKKSEGKQ